MAWTDENLVPEVTHVRNIHVLEMRNKLNYLDSLCWDHFVTWHTTWKDGFKSVDDSGHNASQLQPNNPSALAAEKTSANGENYCPRDYGSEHVDRSGFYDNGS